RMPDNPPIQNSTEPIKIAMTGLQASRPSGHDPSRGYGQPAAGFIPKETKVCCLRASPAYLILNPAVEGWSCVAESVDWAAMRSDLSESIARPRGEQREVEEWSAVADTFAGRVHIEWDSTAPVTPLGQLPFFIEYLKQGGLFDGWVADCPLVFTSPNAPC